MGTLALIGLGSNLGDRKAILDAAVSSLRETPGVEVRAVSRYHETAPVGGPSGQGPFLNAAISLETTLSPFALHDRLKEIERDAGRVRVVRWGERTLDLDLLLFGDEVIDTPDLSVPHPRMVVRRFVLAPLAEVAPEAIEPITGRTVASLLENLDRRPRYVALSGTVYPFAPNIVHALTAIGLLFHELQKSIFWHYEDYERPQEADRTILRLRLEHQAREIYAPRWPSCSVSDRWIVTDYWLSETIEVAEKGFPVDSDWNAIESVARDCLCEPLRPTFAVVVGDGAARPRGDWVKRRNLPRVGCGRMDTRDVPILFIDSNKFCYTIEDVENCPPAPDGRDRYQAFVEDRGHRQAEFVINEILAACASCEFVPDIA